METHPTPSSNQPTTASTEGDGRFFRRAATFCLLAPVLAVAASSVIKVLRAQGPPTTGFEQSGMMIVFFLVIITGAIMGIVSMFGMRKHGPQGILWKAVIGLAMFGTLATASLSILLRPPTPAQGAPPGPPTAPAQP